MTDFGPPHRPTDALVAVADREMGLARIWCGVPGPAGVAVVSLRDGAVEVSIDVADPTIVRAVDALTLEGAVPPASLTAVEHVLGGHVALALARPLPAGDAGVVDLGRESPLDVPDVMRGLGFLALARQSADSGTDTTSVGLGLLDAAGYGFHLPPAAGTRGRSMLDLRIASAELDDEALDRLVRTVGEHPGMALRVERRVRQLLRQLDPLVDGEQPMLDELLVRLHEANVAAFDELARRRSDDRDRWLPSAAASSSERGRAHHDMELASSAPPGPSVRWEHGHVVVEAPHRLGARWVVVREDERVVALGPLRDEGVERRALLPVGSAVDRERAVVELVERPADVRIPERLRRRRRAVERGQRAARHHRAGHPNTTLAWQECAEAWSEAGDKEMALEALRQAEHAGRSRFPRGRSEDLDDVRSGRDLTRRRMGLPALLTDDLVF